MKYRIESRVITKYSALLILFFFNNIITPKEKEMDNNCFFCKSIKNRDYTLENEYAILRFDDFPVNKGHLEIIPKRHVKDWWEATKEERIAIFDLLDEAKIMVDKKYNPDGYNIGMNLGEVAGQSVMHLHVHLIPRYEGDVQNPRGGVRGVIPGKKDY